MSHGGPLPVPRLGADFGLVLESWSIALHHQGKELFKLDIHDLSSIGEDKLALLVGDAIVRAWKSTHDDLRRRPYR